MNFFVPPRQQSLANSTVTSYGIDQTNSVDYRFDKHGFRSPGLLDTQSVIVIGNTLSFGIGLPEEQTYGYQVSKHLNLPYANFSFGCFGHENHDHLTNLSILAQRQVNDILLVQLNNAGRIRLSDSHVEFLNRPSSWCVKRLAEYIHAIDTLFPKNKVLFNYWDDVDHCLPDSVKQRILIHNKMQLDHSLDNSSTFGTKSHYAIYKIIVSKLGQLN